MHVRYTTDEDRIVAEVLEGEVMVVNLANGHYYVMERTGAELWSLLADGSSLSESVTAMSRRYAADRAEIETAVVDFANQLVAEDLLEPVDDVPGEAPGEIPGVIPGQDAPATTAEAPDPIDGLAAFTLPTMYKYTDMANLVQMDPIRDFEESRWPRRRGSGKSPRP